MQTKKKLGFWDKINIRLFVPEAMDMIYDNDNDDKKIKIKPIPIDVKIPLEYKIPYIIEEKEKPKQIPNKPTGDIFNSIIGYENIKEIFRGMLKSEHSMSILLNGAIGTGKSMFIKEILKYYPNSHYVDGSRASKAGIFTILFEKDIRFLLIDELDKLSYSDQEALLTLIQDNLLVETLKNSQRTKKIEHLNVICTSNDIDNIIEPLQSRLLRIPMKKYTKEQFSQISLTILSNRYNINPEIAEHITNRILQLKNPDMRDCEKIAKAAGNNLSLINTILEVSYS